VDPNSGVGLAATSPGIDVVLFLEGPVKRGTGLLRDSMSDRPAAFRPSTAAWCNPATSHFIEHRHGTEIAGEPSDLPRFDTPQRAGDCDAH